jgi:hypothetical protein
MDAITPTKGFDIKYLLSHPSPYAPAGAGNTSIAVQSHPAALIVVGINSRLHVGNGLTDHLALSFRRSRKIERSDITDKERMAP